MPERRFEAPEAGPVFREPSRPETGGGSRAAGSEYAWVAVLLAVTAAGAGAGISGFGAGGLALRGFAATGPAMAASSASLTKAQRELEAQKRRERELLAERERKKKQEQRTLVELERLDKRQSKTAAEVRALKDEIAQAGAQMTAMRTQKNRAAGRMSDAKSRLGEYLRVWRQTPDTERVRDSALWAAWAEAGRLSVARLDQVELRQREEWLNEYLRRQEDRKRSLVAKERELASGRREKARLLLSVRRDMKRSGELLEESKSAQRKLEATLKRLRSLPAPAPSVRPAPSAAKLGQLSWPIQGGIRVVRGYGRQKHSEFNAVVYSSGIEIASRRGTPVRSAGDGRVVHADWLKGYGRVMIVDHGNDFYTVYGHLQEFRARVGQHVNRGAVIGTVGDTGYTGAQGNPSLYFEVRVQGRDKDPRKYLERR